MFRWFIAAGLLAAAPLAAAQTAAQDEARIEELIRREQAVRQVAAGRDTPVAAGSLASGDVAAVAAVAAPAPQAPRAPIPAAAPAGDFADTPEPDPAAPIADADALGGDDWEPQDPKAIAIADLGAHVGTAVRVRSLGGRSRVGRIESVGDAGVTLVSPMGGGYAKYTLPYSQITRIERLQR